MLPKLQLLVSLATAKSKATRQGNGAVQRVPPRRCHGRSRARPGPAAPLRSQRAAVTFRGCAPRSGLQEGAKTPAGAPAAALMLQRAARGGPSWVGAPRWARTPCPLPCCAPGSSHAASSLQPVCPARPGLLLSPGPSEPTARCRSPHPAALTPAEAAPCPQGQTRHPTGLMGVFSPPGTTSPSPLRAACVRKEDTPLLPMKAPAVPPPAGHTPCRCHCQQQLALLCSQLRQ